MWLFCELEHVIILPVSGGRDAVAVAGRWSSLFCAISSTTSQSGSSTTYFYRGFLRTEFPLRKHVNVANNYSEELSWDDDGAIRPFIA